MAYSALYQKYRSQDFGEVVGQEYVVRSIQNAIKNDKVGHAYLFCGPRGTGKTTMARLLAKAIVCENHENAPCGECASCKATQEGNHPDIIEINAANETHVENIRDLIERARLAPMMSNKKVYIIDEVHQLSSSAASALLKTLEEPPEHVIFILATTDPQKLFNTIISRCQRFDFSKISSPMIENHLLDVAKQEGIELEDTAARKIAQLADGGMRDALSILDQLSSYTNNKITEEEINHIYGLSSLDQKLEILNNIFDQDYDNLIENIDSYEKAGLNLTTLIDELIGIMKDVVIWKKTSKESLLNVLTKDEASDLANKAPASMYLQMIDKCIELIGNFKSAQNISTLVEVACLEMASWQDDSSEEVVEEKPKKAKKEKKVEPKNVEYASMDVVGLLVQCTKEEKTKDSEILTPIAEGLPTSKFVAMLKQVELLASGKDCVLFGSDSEAVIHNLNEKTFNEELYLWLRHNGVDKMPFGVTKSEYDQAVKDFVQMRKDNTLPKPMEIVKPEVKEVVEETLEEKAKKLFGDLVEIVEGE